MLNPIQRMTSLLPNQTVCLSKLKKKRITQLSLQHTVKIPDDLHPQLATLTAQAPVGREWLHEIKYDGYRLLAVIKQNTIKLLTRHQQNLTRQLPTLVRALKALQLTDTVLDGELVALDAHGKANFQLLQNALHRGLEHSLVYYLFDILYYNGYKLTSLPLIKRKKILKQILPKSDLSINYSDHIIGNGPEVAARACELQLEGIISKHIQSHYSGRRSRQWLKIKCKQRQIFLIIGYKLPKKNRPYFSSLLLGQIKNGKLKYCGHVGTGFSEALLKLIYDRLQIFVTSTPPLQCKLILEKNVVWIKPMISVEVEFVEWTQDNVLRQPSFIRIVEDKNALISHPQKVLYSAHQFTKQDIAKYYEQMSEWILPYIINRPLTLLRCPKGVEAHCFYQKHLSEALKKPFYGIEIKHKGEDKIHLYIKNTNGLMALIQRDVLEIHPWASRIDIIESPDMIHLDLDPAEDIAWKDVIAAAHLIRAELKKINLVSFVKTSGGKGLHVVIPIQRRWRWDEVKAFSQVFAEYIEQLYPDRYTKTMSKAKRAGKIFIDYFRNTRGATTIAPFSTRARNGAPISVPIAWQDLTADIKANTFNIKQLPDYINNPKKDPWRDFFKLKQSLPK